MEHDSDEEKPTAPSIDAPFDANEAAILLGLSDKQRRFADAILAGANQTQAARAAGYGGEGSALRSTASEVAQSPRVQSYLSWARNNRSGVPNDPATLQEVEMRLSELLRGKDASAAIRAAEVLNRLHTARAEASRDRTPDPIESLNKLAGLSEFGLLVAMTLARAHQIAWKPPEPPAPDAEARQIEKLRAGMSPSDRQRADHIARLQNSSFPAGGSPAGQVTSSTDLPLDDDVTVGGIPYSAKGIAAFAFRGSKT